MTKAIPFLDLTHQTRSVAEEFSARVRDLCQSNSFIGGPAVADFESGFADVCGTRHAVALNSGTDAIRLGLLASGIQSRDEVITSPFTFIATFEAIAQAGAVPVPADIDPATFNLAPASVEQAITERTKAILAVHIFGLPADMGSLIYLGLQNNLAVFEDASQAHGAAVAGQPTGSLGAWAAFSFYPTKNLGAFGDAGALTTDDPDVAGRMRLLRNHGQTGSYAHRFEGYNSRMDALQAALLTLKLVHLDPWTAERRALAQIYREELQGVEGFRLQSEPERFRHSYHILAGLAERRRQLMEHLSARGVESKIIYPTPVHLLEAYRYLGYAEGAFPNCEEVCRRVTCLPIYPGLSREQALRAARAVKEFYVG